MRLKVPLTLALRYWRQHWLRALVMFVGLVVGMTLLGGVLLVNDSLARTYAGWQRGVLGYTDIEVRAVSDAGLTEAWLDEIRRAPGVAAAAPVVERRSYLLTDDARLAVNVRGVDPVAEGELRPFGVVAGRALEVGDRRVTMLSHAAALDLNAGPGSDVELLTPSGVETLRVVGVYHPLGDHVVAERVATLPLQESQALFAPGRNSLSRIDVATDGRPVAAVQAALNERLHGQAHVRLTGDDAGALAQASRGLTSLLLLAGLLGVLAAGVLIVVYLRTMLEERARDLRVLHALGVPRAGLHLSLWAEVALGVAAAALPGLVLAAPLARWLLTQLPSDLLPYASSVAAPRLGPSALSLDLAITVFGAAVALLSVRTLLAKLLGSLARAAQSGTGFAPQLRLASHFFAGRVGGAATVGAAIALTTAGLIGVHGASEAQRSALTAWLDGAVNWDLMVASVPGASGANVTLPVSAMEQIAGMPGVEAVSAERQVAVSSDGRSVTMIALDGFGLDAGNRLSVVHSADLSGSSAWFDLRQGQGVALSVPLADRLAVSVGDSIPLSTLDGESSFTVLALVADASSRAEAAYIALDNYAAMWGDSGVDSIQVRVSAGPESVALVETALSEQAQRSVKVPLHVTLAGAYRADLLAAADDTFRAARLMILLGVLMALLALLVSSVVAAWRAEPELAGLRAMGVPRASLLGVLLVNLMVTAAAGALPGMLLGTLLSRRLSLTTLDGAAQSWNWPVDAYGYVLALLALTAVLAALMLASPDPRLNLLRQSRR